MFAGLASAVAAAPVPLQCKPFQTLAASIKIDRLSPDVWLLPASIDESNASNSGFISNMVLVRGGPRVWLVGSGPSPDKARVIQCAILKQLGLEVTDLINPRSYAEVTLGNSAFATRRIWAHEAVAKQMQLRCSQCVERLAARLGGQSNGIASLADVRLPTQLFSGGHGIVGPFEWWLLERGKLEPTLLLRHRFSPVWITSGLVWNNITPDLLDADLQLMLRQLSFIEQRRPGLLVPEQGAAGTKEMLTEQIKYWQQVQTQIKAELGKASPVVTPDQLADQSTFKQWPLFQERHSLNLQRAWRQLEEASLR
jgi:hypothetical protein